MTEAIEEVKEHSPAHGEILHKYQTAAQLANKALIFALSQVKAGASVLDICRRTDEELVALASKVYNKGRLLKGVAFPCCVSVNNVLGYFSPVDSEYDMNLQDGDLVKIELGAHIDGFPALVGSSVVVGASKDNPVTGPAANLVHAAHLVSEATLRLLRAGKTSKEVAEIIKKMTSELGVNFVEGMISHSINKNRLADEKMIVVRPAEGQAKMIETSTFSNYDVFVIDISLSSGKGSIRASRKHQTTVYKRTEQNHSLRLKTSRGVINEIQSKFGLMAFNLRSLENVNRARLALNEATQHQVTTAYEVLEEKDKETLTARFMFTVIVMPAGPLKITDYRYASENVKATNTFKSKDLIDLLDTPVRAKKERKTAP